MKSIITILFVFLSTFLYSQNSDTLTIVINYAFNQNFGLELQKALDVKFKKNLKVLIKKGDYLLNQNIRTASNHTTIVFEKGARVLFTNSEDCGITISNDDCVIKNGTFVGNGISTKDFYKGFGVLLLGAQRTKIINNKFSKISGINVFLYPNTKGIGCNENLISNNFFEFPVMDTGKRADDAFVLLGYSGTNYFHNNNIISRNILNGNDRLDVGIGIIGHGNNNRIESNKISNLLSYGIIAYESVDNETTLNGTIVKNNEIYSIGEVGNDKTVKGMGIYLMKSNNSEVIGNKVTNAMRNSDRTETLGAGAISVGMSPNSTIKQNTIIDSNMYGIVVSYSFNSTVLSNTINNSMKSGLYLINLSDVIVESNIIEKSGEVAIKGYFQSMNLPNIIEMYTNKASRNKTSGENISIANNRFIDNKDNILFFSGVTDLQKNNSKTNLIRNNFFKKNVIVGHYKNIDDVVNFRNEVINSNIIKENTISNK